MSFRIIYLGKGKSKALESLEQDYLKRITKYYKLELICLDNSKFSKLESAETIKKESELLLKKLKANEFLIALDEHGSELKTIELSSKISTTLNSKSITFVIGGPQGLDANICKRANLVLSLSKLTFTAEFARIILLEQIYRCVSIIKGLPYHRGDQV